MKKILSVILVFSLLLGLISGAQVSATECEHEYEVYYDLVDFNCHSGGRIEYFCFKCGDFKTEEADFFEHELTATGTVKEPTCTEDGYVQYKCGTCSHIYNVVWEATGHSLSVVDSGYYTSGMVDDYCKCYFTDYLCSVCGEYVEEREYISEHSFVETKRTEVTCVDYGEIQYTCEECGMFKNEYIEPTYQHDFVLASTYIDEYYCYASNIYRCKTCGVEDYEFLGQQHKLVYQYTIAVSCTNDGYDIYKCSACDNEIWENRIPMHNNSGVYVRTVAPTCNMAGYDLYRCNLCGEEYEKNYNYNYAQHTPLGGYDYMEDYNACTEGITYHYSNCAVCDASFDIKGEPLGHDYQTETFVSGVCTDTDGKIYECSRCFDRYDEITRPATEHTLEVRITNEFECNYSKEVYCSVCSYFGEWSSYTEHNYTEGVLTHCDKKGYSYKHCADCGNDEITAINAISHSYKRVSQKEGNISYYLYSCSSCGHYNGDLNDDSKLNIIDLIRMKKTLVKSTASEDMGKYDCTEDGKFDGYDLIYIRKAVLRLLQ